MAIRPAKRMRSIGGRLNRLVLLSVGAALLLAGVFNVWHEANRYLDAKRETLLATAQVFGAASSRAVAAKDAPTVLQSLRAIGRIPSLSRAEVYDSDGKLLADLGQVVRLDGDLDLDELNGGSIGRLLASRTVRLSAPIVQGGRTVGRIVLIGDTADIQNRLGHALAIAVAGSAAALVLGLLLSYRLQRRITRPLRTLTAAMAAVEETGRYETVPLQADDETGLLADRFNSMIGEIRSATDEILAREDEIIARLSRAGEQRDDQTGEHVIRVAKISRLIADELGLDPKWTADFCRASPMHDVGKISIPDAILFKPGKLDAEERRQMEAHAEAGHAVLAGSNSPLVQLAAEIAISHHEKWDGTGYPRRIAGEAIPLSGRITAVADVCDALLSERPYKKPWPIADVKAHLAESAGGHFDPTCVAALLRRWTDLEAIYRRRPEAAAMPLAQAA